MLYKLDRVYKVEDAKPGCKSHIEGLDRVHRGVVVYIYRENSTLGVYTLQNQVKDVNIKRIKYHYLMIACEIFFIHLKVCTRYVNTLDSYVKIICTICTYFIYRHWYYVYRKTAYSGNWFTICMRVHVLQEIIILCTHCMGNSHNPHGLRDE